MGTKDHDVWIIVCEGFHGAVGPIASEALAREIAAATSSQEACTYRPVQLLVAGGSSDAARLVGSTTETGARPSAAAT